MSSVNGTTPCRFKWEIPHVERETRAYQLLEGSGLSARFLGHIYENGCIMGFLLEKIEGRADSIQDLKTCETALERLHGLGIFHGDANRSNFLVTGERVKLLDFEHFQEDGSPGSMRKELESVRVELMEDSGRGGGFIIQGDGN
ncbi:unnamed protein product [Penicillium salamii]|uniref:Protein kinase domain-containing protein n=1 Tax=Penicillium salamii TaxID=1612424 RepID=A0A9W4IUA3_9EURO|nr:unnamed protein product [Penicillium salamii]CAG8365344.1 unnamed protein product [Penicillium salamii]CAG8367587.1 unnamed protein product [Penicillium salamii]CAG8406857.1 unnamed protein product [Penicillium salamii]